MIVLADKAYVPLSMLDSHTVAKLKKDFQTHSFVEKSCASCDNRHYRPNDVCQNCPGYVGLFRFWDTWDIRGIDYISLPLGNRDKLIKYVPSIARKVNRSDLRVKAKLSFDLEFTGSLYDFQKVAVRELLKYGYGILQSAPRTGKTVVATAVVCHLGLKTVILAHQTDLLTQFLDTFHKFTDILATEKFQSRRLVGICNKVEDFNQYEICLATYQQFISAGGKRRLNKVRGIPGLLIIDEVHKGNAHCYSRVINQFKSRYRFGMTATPDRKDGLQFVVDNIVGPVIHTTTAESLKPVVALIETGTRTNYNYSSWTYAMRFLERQEPRNELILKHVVADIKRGRHVLMPVIFQSQAVFWVNAINEYFDEPVAAGYHGKVSKIKREKVLDDARSGKIKCVIAMRSMLLGINVPIWDCVDGSTLLPTSTGLHTVESLYPGNPHEKTVTLHNGKSWKNACFGGRIRYGKSITITPQKGTELKCSPGHKLLVLREDFTIGYKEAGKLQIDDYVLLRPSGCVVQKQYQITGYTFDPQRFFGVFEWRDLDGKSECSICGIRSANLTSHVKNMHNSLVTQTWTPYQRYERHKKLMRQELSVPETVCPKLGYIIGFLLSDGAIRKGSIEFYNQDQTLINRVKRCMLDVFGLTTVEINSGLNKELRYFDVRLVDFFHYLGIYGKSYQKTVPDCILQSPEPVINAFLSAYLDADGCCSSYFIKSEDAWHHQVLYTSTSRDMLIKIQTLLFHTYGLLGSLMSIQHPTTGYNARPIYNLVFTSSTATQFKTILKKSVKVTRLRGRSRKSRTVIPFASSMFKKLTKDTNGWYETKDGKKRYTFDSVRTRWGRTIESVVDNPEPLTWLETINNPVALQIKKTLLSLVKNRLVPVRIKAIQDSGNIPLYDVTMVDSGQPSYISGSFVSHNCLYEIMPIANPPNFEQEIKRICTAISGKPEPRIKFFIDDMGVCKGCFRVCWKTFKEQHIQFTEKSRPLLGKYLSGGKKPMLDHDERQFKPVRTQTRRL